MKCLNLLIAYCVVFGVKCGDPYAYGPFSLIDHPYGNYDLKIFDPDRDQVGGEPIIKQTILDVLTDVLKSCDDSFSKAETRINLALNQIDSYDGKSIIIEEFLSNLDSQKSFHPTPFSWKFTPPRNPIHEKIHEYREELSYLLLTVKEACLNLPAALPDESIFEKSRNEIVDSLITWSRKWFGVFQQQMIIFIEKCQLSVKCSNLLNQVINLSVFIVEKEELTDVNEALDAILSLLKSDSNYGNSLRDFTNLWYNIVDTNREEIDPYWLAEGMNIKELDGNIQNSKSNADLVINKGYLEIDTHFVVHTVPKEFLSFALASKLIQEKLRDLPEKRTRLLNLATGLMPAYIRLGGTASNFLTYDDAESTEDKFLKIKGWSYDESWVKNSLHPKFSNSIDRIKGCMLHTENKFTNFTMTKNQWKFFVDFTKDLKSVLIFDLNQFKRDDLDFWDPTNAKLLMEDDATKEITVIWQLGNEPNSYLHKHGKIIEPEKAAIDFRTLKKQLDHIYPNQKHFIVGPDVTQPKYHRKSDYMENNLEEDSMKYLATFLKHAGDVIDAVTWHHYYFDGRTATISDFTSVEKMNFFVKQLDTIVHTRNEWASDKPIWMTETANAWGGGSHQLSSTFVSTFIWLDKLGAAALGGVSIVYREALYGGCYGMIDRKLRPTPTYWVSVLHKQLVGQNVLLPRVRLAPEGLRIYSHCMNKKHPLYEKGAVVVFGINVGDNAVSLQLSNEEQRNSTIYEFRLTAPFGELESLFILLNGEVMEVNKTGKLPRLIGREIQNQQLVLQPKTLVYYALLQAKINFC